VPVSGARVTVIAADGSAATAIESRVVRAGTATPAGTGVYQFLNVAVEPTGGATRPPGFGPTNEVRVVRGQRYRLRVELPDGRVTTGETRVPGDPTTPDPGHVALTFNRDVDTLRLRWPAVPGARTYALRIESPYGAFFLFVDSTSVDLSGELRNLFADRLPRVFLAGFTQNVYVAAVDTNYFDYYRSSNNPFTGSGIINRLTGGVGLFGSYVPVLSRALFVRSGDHDAVDGRYIAPSPAGPETLRLWIDDRKGDVASVSGALRLADGQQFGVLGTLTGDRLRLSARDFGDWRFTHRTIDGTVRGDTIRAQLAGLLPPSDAGARVYVRSAQPPATP
jgi:hypothetical protein